MAQARRCWIVFVDNQRNLYESNLNGGGYIGSDRDTEQFSVFFKESQASAAAQVLSKKNPGYEVYILEQKSGYCSQPKPPELKLWTSDGQYIPAP